MQVEYIRLARGLQNQTSELVPITENIQKLVAQYPKADFYTSLYRYQDKHFEQFKKTRSVAGIKDVTTPKLLFDFDDSQNIEGAKADAITLCDRLIEKGAPEDKIRIWFSGNKGFHVELITREAFRRQEFYNIVANLAGDLKSFDHRINDEARVIRVPFTQHPKTSLYKIPLNVSELKNLTMEDISSKAISTRDYTKIKYSDENFEIDLSNEIKQLKNIEYKSVTKKEVVEELTFNIQDLNFSKAPKWMSKERFALQEGYFLGSESTHVGERNTAFMILAATYKAQGFSADHTQGLLEATAEKQAKRTGEDPYTPEQLRREVINTVFSPTWQGGIYGKDEDLLVKTRERFGIVEFVGDESDAVGISDVGEGFKEFAKTIKSNRILVGLDSLDKNLVLTTGMVCTVVAAPGAGKTALSNLFAETVSKAKEDVLYFSLDLFKNLLFTRMLQRHIDYNFQTILDQFETGDIDEELLKAYANVVDSYENVNFVFKTSTIESIEEEIVSQSQRRGKTPKLVIVDYLDKVRTQHSDPTHSSALIAGRLSDLAKKYNCLILLLVQPSKMGSSGPEQEFKSYRSLKGSSAIESDSRVILGIHRPGYNPSDQTDDNFSTITILKNNTGPLGRYDFAWNGQAGTFTELNMEQKVELKRIRDHIEAAKLKNEYDI